MVPIPSQHPWREELERHLKVSCSTSGGLSRVWAVIPMAARCALGQSHAGQKLRLAARDVCMIKLGRQINCYASNSECLGEWIFQSLKKLVKENPSDANWETHWPGRVGTGERGGGDQVITPWNRLCSQLLCPGGDGMGTVQLIHGSQVHLNAGVLFW